MLRVIIKRAPSVFESEQYRINISENPAERGVDLIVRGDTDVLRQFLTQRLELGTSQVTTVLGQLAASRVAASQRNLHSSTLAVLMEIADSQFS